jgi:hypothetical protein
MPDEKQTGLVRDMLDSAKSIRLYLDEVTRDAFLANQEKQDAVLAGSRSSAKPPAALHRRHARCFRTFRSKA